MLNVKSFFHYTYHNGRYITVVLINGLRSTATPVSYIKKIKEVNGNPFVIYKDITWDEDSLKVFVDNIKGMSILSGLSKEEIVEMDIDNKRELVKKLIHCAIYGFVLDMSSKDELYDAFEKLKMEFSESNINIQNTHFRDIDYVNYLKEQKVIEDDTLRNDAFRKLGFKFSTTPKKVTDSIIKEIERKHNL